MKIGDFESVVSYRVNFINKVLVAKAKEYATEEDRLHNFKTAGKARNVTAVKAAEGMMLKHIVSFWDIIDTHEEHGDVPTQEVIDEKFGDIINYLILIDALFQDARENK